ncbi:diguanylate cyclase [Desulfobacterales bacterium HSG2]|nr:diguanylate cyclase [Desulfobacterales bacterium HSG2]
MNETEKKSNSHRDTVLIVDDNPSNLGVIENYLKKYGFMTLVATTGETALKRAELIRPDIILLDVLMTGMDGFETCRLLKANDATRDIPVIFMTVLSDTVDKVRGFEVGGTDYVTKPFQTEELLARVRTHLTIRKLQQQLRERNVFLEKTDTIVRAINSEINLTELLETILRESFVIRGVERAFALIYDRPLNAYVCKAARGVDVSDLGHVRMSLSEAEERYVRDSKEIDEDIFTVGHVQGRPGEAKFRHVGIAKSILVFRIRTDRHAEGYLILCNMSREQAFGEQDIRLLKNLKGHITSAFVRSRLLAELKEMSLTDTLTGMRNRRYLLKTISTDIAKVRRDYREWFLGRTENPPANSDIVFLMLDLDHFKSVNDTYGHDAGDRVLVRSCEILRNACRDTDIPVRWGGEEFLLVVRHSDRHRAHIVAERLRRRIEANPFDIGGGQTVHLTCSVGLASYPFSMRHSDCLNWEQVVAVADKALYAAKMSGRNAWVCIMNTEQTRPDRLFEKIQDDMGLLIRSGELQVRTSVPDAENLVFQ